MSATNSNATVNLAELIAKHIEVKAKADALKNELSSLEASIKEQLEAREITEYRENGFVAKVEEYTQRKFDTTRFKKENGAVYESYRKDVNCKKFSAYVEA